MSPVAHRIYIGTLSAIVIAVTAYLFYVGLPYYLTPLEERFYHPNHDYFKPSGLFGHGLGIVGTLLILIGVFGYIARKRYTALFKLGRLKYWLEFHIFLCTLGPIMILFHTAFKFGGIVSVSFWSMVAVVVSGVVGRYIYIRIPRSIEGRELGLNEIQNMRDDMNKMLKSSYGLSEENYAFLMAATEHQPHKGGNYFSRKVNKYFQDKKTIRQVKKTLKENNTSSLNIRKVTKIVKEELAINNRIENLQTMQKLFKYWHVAHMPFAVVMLIIMVIHVGVTLAFGYTWIFK